MECQLSPFLAGLSWVPGLCLSFLICKMGLVLLSISQGCCEMKMRQCLAQGQVGGECLPRQVVSLHGSVKPPA